MEIENQNYSTVTILDTGQKETSLDIVTNSHANIAKYLNVAKNSVEANVWGRTV